MNKKIILILTFLIPLSIVLFIVFYPQKYDLKPLSVRENTHYWTLETGSKIAYNLIPASGIKKPFPIIYLHGGPGGFVSENTIKTLTPLSENGYDVYVYDQIGSGFSDRLMDINNYTAERHKNDLEAIVKAIKAEKVIIIGQSWGAFLAILFAADNADKINKLILTGAGPIFPINETLRGIKSPDSLQLKTPIYSNQQANEKMNNLRTKTVALWAKVFGKPLATDKEMDAFQTLLTNETSKSIVCDTSKAPKTAETGGNGYYAQIMTMRSLSEIGNPRTKLTASKIPLYLMRGQCDNQKWGFITEYLSLFQKHKLVIIPNAGHSIAIEQPALYLSTLRDFLNE
jgi:proline iminopeptidase